ncbi:hypothetical protein ALFP_0148 [Alcaligenes faecalis]|nr:hypothetical protein ALFP_0148 [Alcaligenes faecalis]
MDEGGKGHSSELCDQARDGKVIRSKISQDRSAEGMKDSPRQGKSCYLAGVCILKAE